MRKQRRVPGVSYDKISKLARRNWQPADIKRQLELEGLPPVSLPTIRDIVREMRPPDPSGRWSVMDANGDDARHVLPALAAVFEMTEGRISSFSRLEAETIAKISRAMESANPAIPNLHPSLIWMLASEYVARRLDGHDDFEALDSFLAFWSVWGNEDVSAERQEFIRTLWLDALQKSGAFRPDWLFPVGWERDLEKEVNDKPQG